MALVLRPAEPGDAEAIRAIYNASVAAETASLDTEPRSAEAQADWMRRHDFDPWPAFVAESGGEVVGWASLSPYNPKPGYRTTAENSLYVHADQRRSGVGAALLGHLIEAAPGYGIREIVALITGTNLVSLRLHERLGFRHVGRLERVGRKFDQWVDVVLMQRSVARD
ncbi:MAG: N-acetyltransferase family protein [Armatimonadota bacterium]